MRKLITYMLLLTLLGSNFVWAGEGHVDDAVDQTVYNSQQFHDINSESTENHPQCAHDGHMSSHLLGLSVNASVSYCGQSSEHYPRLNISLNSQHHSPPSKPPRA